MAWTPEIDGRIVALRNEGLAFSVIAVKVDRPLSTVTQRYRKVVGLPVRSIPVTYERDLSVDAEAEIAAAAWSAREMEASRTGNITALFFGDPLPGRSALDRRAAQ